jgi:hypothetical protein
VCRPGLDAGTLGLKETFNLLRGVCLAAGIGSVQGIVSLSVDLVAWCCRNMRPIIKPARRSRKHVARERRHQRHPAIFVTQLMGRNCGVH